MNRLASISSIVLVLIDLRYDAKMFKSLSDILYRHRNRWKNILILDCTSKCLIFAFRRPVRQEMMDPSSPLGKHRCSLKRNIISAHCSPRFSGQSHDFHIIESIAQKFPALKGKIRSLSIYCRQV